MSNALEHFSRSRVENTTLQVMADSQRDLARLIREEEAVIRHYVRLGGWPHKAVNLFVLENLQPLVSQIMRAAALNTAVAEDIDRRPMVNVYDAADLSECTIFVNRHALKQDGVWSDALALRALLAHEHGHPLAENATVQAARALSVDAMVEGMSSTAAIPPILQLLADRLCVHAPQEVFANEIAIRADFGDALFHLDRGAVEKARLGVAKRASLVEGLDRQVRQGKLDAGQAAAFLLVGDLQAYAGFALETAPFLAAGHPDQAATLEAALEAGVWPHLDAAVLPLYENLRDRYRGLRSDLGPDEMKTWAEAALAVLAATLGERHLRVQFALVPARANPKRSHNPGQGFSAKRTDTLAHDGAAS
ncbi:MAG: hypothetical protein P4M09_20010 [Devosia sp.]|nr:hypothetical protein [Devosia sp.]